LPQLFAWFGNEHVFEWWPDEPNDWAKFQQHWQEKLQKPDVAPFIVYFDALPLGYIQYYTVTEQARSWLPPLPEHTVGIDQFIGESNYIGKGYGALLIAAFIKFLKNEIPNVQAIIVDPNPTNTRAIKCYQKVGFAKVGEYKSPWGLVLIMRFEC
ncbi:MAG TPA: GNAT family N-acetyltransferase, partial [Candidatus Limnocylindria bacterium]|nr:GNAT family N-acetyltransferase [Candidatus Limnocylindria bacterium]